MFVDAPNEIMIYNDGIEACREPWDQRAVKEPPTECLVQLLTLVLNKGNNKTTEPRTIPQRESPNS
jgi:hypothetical protein